MQLMSLKCPNCDGPLKMVKEGTFYCANCDSAFMADYDKDDLEYQKMKVEEAIRKQQMSRKRMDCSPREDHKAPDHHIEENTQKRP